MKNLRKSLTYEKLGTSMWFSKKILQKSYEKLRTKLCKTYYKLTTTLQVSYENVKFATSDVIQETLWQRLSLVDYFELKITDKQSDDFQRMFSKNDLSFSKKILGHRISLTYKKLMKILQQTWEKSYENLMKFQKSVPWAAKDKLERCSQERPTNWDSLEAVATAIDKQALCWSVANVSIWMWAKSRWKSSFNTMHYTVQSLEVSKVGLFLQHFNNDGWTIK